MRANDIISVIRVVDTASLVCRTGGRSVEFVHRTSELSGGMTRGRGR